MQKSIGGDRLGSGKKMKAELHNYSRSTHDLGYIWRSSMASGTLVPFLSEVGLPGDTMDFDIDINVLTHPSVGPLFGSFKVQCDVFMAPMRLYNKLLHNNQLGIGLNMNQVFLPQVRIPAKILQPSGAVDADNEQINPSSIFSYLNIRGCGRPTAEEGLSYRDFNAIPYLAYWEIYKNYYANKQEEIGAVIHNEDLLVVDTVTGVTVEQPYGSIGEVVPETYGTENWTLGSNDALIIAYDNTTPDINNIQIRHIDLSWTPLVDMFETIFDTGTAIVCQDSTIPFIAWGYIDGKDTKNGIPKITTFPLDNIDLMRESILGAIKTVPFVIEGGDFVPYDLPMRTAGNADTFAMEGTQEGLALKTYQSDLFNNWMQTEWLDGVGGINEITAVSTVDGNFEINQLILARKVYDMLNRIAISGGSYDDWLDAVYVHERARRCESPMYMGGLSRELVFQEVVSNSGSDEQPLGTLAGRGTMSGKKKGGSITVRVDEPCYIIGIASLTPRIDYSQGNKWDTNLKTMDDLHKPALDEIGFQDLITDQMAWWDTVIENNDTPIFKSAGKQPAWINYMTNVNQVRGNFARKNDEMFMTLNRRYEKEVSGGLRDLTTYIDPSKFNFIFAQTSRDAQNFWTQIRVENTARRKMSAKIMPNL